MRFASRVEDYNFSPKIDCLFCMICLIPELHNFPEDEVIDETIKLYAKPGLGHFAEGYTLILTKDHYPSYAYLCLNDLRELDLFKQSIKSNLESIYRKPIIAFEHGYVDSQNRASSCANSCIDHAHLHLLPCDVDLQNLLIQKFDYETISETTELSKYKTSKLSYIYYESISGEKFVFTTHEQFPSQFLRRLLCENLGIPDMWDWTVFPFREKIESFKKAYNSYKKQIKG